MAARAFSTVQLVNGSTGDPVLYLDYPGCDNALLFDGGENHALSMAQLADLEAVFISHHHVDHFIGLDRIMRANIDRDKTLHIFGPENTIQKVYDRIRSYEYPFFPFQKITVEVTELLKGQRRTALLECTKRFPPPDVREEKWSGRICYDNANLQVEAVQVDHTVPCLAYALAEKTGFHPDSEKLKSGLLRPGAWVQEVLQQLRAGADGNTSFTIQGGQFNLENLKNQYFVESPGARIAFVTDTLYTEELKPTLLKLCKGAWQLYCDSFYARAQEKSAKQYKHMMAYQSAELAKAAKVEHLILIHHSTRYSGNYDLLLQEAAEVFPRVSSQI